LYKDKGKSKLENKYPLNALMLAEQVASCYQPDPIWVCDICETYTGILYLLEIGCFSCAGLYACDTDLIVEAVNESAWKEYEELI